jgi:hypothetical protein
VALGAFGDQEVKTGDIQLCLQFGHTPSLRAGFGTLTPGSRAITGLSHTAFHPTPKIPDRDLIGVISHNRHILRA